MHLYTVQCDTKCNKLYSRPIWVCNWNPTHLRHHWTETPSGLVLSDGKSWILYYSWHYYSVGAKCVPFFWCCVVLYIIQGTSVPDCRYLCQISETTPSCHSISKHCIDSYRLSLPHTPHMPGTILLSSTWIAFYHSSISSLCFIVYWHA